MEIRRRRRMRLRRRQKHSHYCFICPSAGMLNPSEEIKVEQLGTVTAGEKLWLYIDQTDSQPASQ